MMVTNKGMTAALRRLKVEKNMKSKIVVDSSANVYELPDVGFACVPLKILTDEQEYVDPKRWMPPRWPDDAHL